jgi:hypothetical protein
MNGFVARSSFAWPAGVPVVFTIERDDSVTVQLVPEAATGSASE